MTFARGVQIHTLDGSWGAEMMIPYTIVGESLYVLNDESPQNLFDNANAEGALLKLGSSNFPEEVASPKLNDCAAAVHPGRQG